jgi:glycosyltransferase involved in cell wall biosynthesis
VKILLFANTDWYLYNFRLALAQALRERGDEVVLVSPDGPYGPRMQEMGFRWLQFPLARRSLNLLAEIQTIVHLFKLYRREKPDLVHQFTVKCVLYGSLACRLLGIRSVVNSVTGLGYVFMEGEGARRWLRGLIKLFYRLVLRPSWVIFQNPDDRAFFLENRLVDPKRVALIRGSGVDIRHFSPRPVSPGIPLVILPARLLWDKGVGEFVEAARRLQAEGFTVSTQTNVPHARFALIGDSDDENPASVHVSQLQDWEKEGVIEWWGWKENMKDVYAQASIVCLPSYREGLPKTLIEAAACGRPIVASDVPGCREVVRHGENGLLVPVRDASALAEALMRLLQSPNMRSEMGIRSRTIAENEFSIELVISQTFKLYLSCRNDHLKRVL